MKLRFDKRPPKEVLSNTPPYVIRPLDSLNMDKEVDRLGLSSGQWCYALVHDATLGQIVLAEVFHDGVWAHAGADIVDKKVFDQYKKEEKHHHSFKAYQKACLAESVYHTIVRLDK